MRVRAHIPFWSDERQWPHDQPGYMFLLRAVNEVGHAMYSDGWTESEYLATIPRLPEDWVSADSNILKRANQMLIEHRPDLGRQPIPRGTKLPLAGDRGVNFTVEEWKAARELDQQQIMESKSALERFERVARQLVAWLASGELTSVLRQLPGGAVKHWVTSDQWITERWWLRFVRGQMRPYSPFEAPKVFDSRYPQWIFVSKDSLNACCRSLRQVKHTIDAELETRRWLQGQMYRSLERRPPGVTKATLREQAQKEFKVGCRPFERAWRQAIKETGAKWDRPGAPLKPSQ
jgi:hypothetical protein